MKRILHILAATLTLTAASAQEPGRIYRTEAVPFDIRQEALTGERGKSGHAIEFRPQILAAGDELVVGERIEIPYHWTDGVVYMHVEHVRSAYTLFVNDKEVARVEDSSTPADFEITPCIRQGANDIRIAIRESASERINAEPIARTAFSGSYLYFQNSRSIRDFEIALVPDPEGRQFGVLDLKIIARNAYNFFFNV